MSATSTIPSADACRACGSAQIEAVLRGVGRSGAQLPDGGQPGGGTGLPTWAA